MPSESRGTHADPRAAIPAKTRSSPAEATTDRPRSASTNLRDVADRSGVSVTTASRILNGRATGVPIRDDTRERVLTAAADLGYKPNLLARGLRGSRSSLIGVIARDISDPFHIQILQGINEITNAREFRLFLGHVDYRPDVALSYGSIRQPDPEPSYRLGLDLFGASDRRPTAIYATSDTIAIGLLQAAYQTGVVVPDQVSIVGFDNIAIAAYTVPPLTTVSQSGTEMGRAAAALLLDMIESDQTGVEVEDIVLEPSIIVRDSTARPPGFS
jgi:DNA-binding LacI/PurR family transcriptional regulator